MYRTIQLHLRGAALISAILSPLALGQHAGDLWVGRSAAGQLKIGGSDPQASIVVLPPIVNPGVFSGWSGNNPGFDRLMTPSPAQDLYSLASGARINLEVLSIDAAFRAIDSGFQLLDTPGDRTYLGDQNLHTHLTWHLNSADPAFDPTHCVWEAVFQLVDTGSTGYKTSEPLRFRFATHVPVPADFNCDADVDLDDFGHFQACGSGAEIPQSAPECLNADLDGDGDVDQDDFGVFQRCFSGSDHPADPGCANT